MGGLKAAAQQLEWDFLVNQRVIRFKELGDESPKLLNQELDGALLSSESRYIVTRCDPHTCLSIPLGTHK